MGKKGGGPSLGRNLMKSQGQTKKVRRAEQQEGYLHTADLQDGYDWGRLNLQSVTEDDTYTDFMNTAEMAGREFDAEKWNVKLLDAQTRKIYIDTDVEEKKTGLTEEEKILPIPRRPVWNGLTPELLKEKENENFLEWRRILAHLQEERECVVTPYEKNLDFWRQLWRVIERSDLIIQIVDSRDPLLFRSPDLELYVKEVSALKNNLILINKADFLSEDQRNSWADYLTKNNIDFCFFSAIQEDEDTDSDDNEVDAVNNSEDDNEDSTDVNSDDNPEHNTEDEPIPILSTSPDKVDEVNTTPSKNDILTSSRLVDLFRSYKRYEEESITVGFIGYPNVGKSSTINKLLSSKKVKVSETPGKTKHFQTLLLEDDITLCDCPGLVMPSICNSKAGMVLQGILPIDQLRDHVPVMNLLISVIPNHVLESKYGLVLPQAGCLTSEQLLTAYGTLRGFMTAGGRPDQSRAARLLLKDYVGGKLLHCSAPPDQDQDKFHSHIFEVRRVFMDEEHKEQEARRLQQMKFNKPEKVDNDFFARSGGGVHVRGKKKLEGRFSDKGKSKTKARVMYADLDPKRHGHE